MNCVRCGSELPKGATICSRCGCKNEMVEHSRIKEIIIFVMTMVSEFLILQNLLFILEDVKDYIKDIFKSAEFSFSAEMSLLFAVGILISIAVTIMYIVKFLRNSADCENYSKRNNETIIGIGVVLIAYYIAETIEYGKLTYFSPTYAMYIIIFFVAVPMLLSIFARVYATISRKRG